MGQETSPTFTLSVDSIRRGTTPSITLTVDNEYEVAYATDIWVTFEQPSTGVELTHEWKRYPDPDDPDANEGILVDNQDVIVVLTQEETLAFSKGEMQVQIKMKKDVIDGGSIREDVVGTVIKKIKVERILNENVMQ